MSNIADGQDLAAQRDKRVPCYGESTDTGGDFCLEAWGVCLPLLTWSMNDEACYWTITDAVRWSQPSLSRTINSAFYCVFLGDRKCGLHLLCMHITMCVGGVCAARVIHVAAWSWILLVLCSEQLYSVFTFLLGMLSVFRDVCFYSSKVVTTI